jgi:TPR repeat protein
MKRENLKSFVRRRAKLDEAARFALGEGRQVDYGRAIRLYRAESKAGSGEATYNLATMYFRGEGVKRSWSTAKKLLRLGETQGSADASMLLGELSLSRKGKSSVNCQRAISHFAIAAFRGDIRGLREIASLVKSMPKLRTDDVGKAVERSIRIIARQELSKR